MPAAALSANLAAVVGLRRAIEARMPVDARCGGLSPMFTPGDALHGHEFHYSQTRYDRAVPAFALEGGHEGYARSAVAAFAALGRAFGRAA